MYKLSRLLLPLRGPRISHKNFHQQNQQSIVRTRNQDQIDYIKFALNKNRIDWTEVKHELLQKSGDINSRNIDGVLFKYLTSNKHYDAALSYADYVKNVPETLNLGSINGLLQLYSQLSNEKQLTDEQKSFILDSYKKLYDKYKVLDATTCDCLLHALCAINEWKKAIRVKEDIFLSGKPTHSAYSTLIVTLFKDNKKTEALKMIQESMNHRRPLQDKAYKSWINFILTKYKDKKTKVKHLDELCKHLSMNFSTVSTMTAVAIKEAYISLDWRAEFAKIRKQNGQCSCCNKELECFSLSTEQFQLLQKNIKDKLIVGSDLFLKTLPQELESFLRYIDKTAPYDIVLDALNIAYMVDKHEQLRLLNYVVDHFKKQNKKILLLGRKHMLKWPKRQMDQLRSKVFTFFTENISQDDPYMITAAIMSGPNTDIVSKDLLRGHIFLLRDEEQRMLFKMWQWQHQWMIFLNKNNGIHIQEPLKFTPCAQRKGDSWHIPYEREEFSKANQVNDGIPDLSSWICISPKNR